jgi:hypothetical protein
LRSDATGKVISVGLDVAVPGLDFDETFSPPASEPIGELPGARFYVQAIRASDGSVRSLLLLDPRSAGLSYSTLGMWMHQPDGSITPTHVGVLAVGAETRSSDIPTTGSANYNGVMTGIYANEGRLYRVGATAAAQANFGTRTIALNTAGSQRVELDAPAAAPVADAGLDLSGTLTYDPGRNVLVNSGSFRTTGNRMPTGYARGRFFGPAAAELGGSFFVRNGSSTGSANNTETMSGGFVLKK